MATRRTNENTGTGESKPKPRRREVTTEDELVLHRRNRTNFFITNPGETGKKITISPNGGITIGKN